MAHLLPSHPVHDQLLARTDLSKAQLISLDVFVHELFLGRTPFTVDEFRLVSCGTCREDMLCHSKFSELSLERSGDLMYQMRKKTSLLQVAHQMRRMIRGSISAQDMCDVSTRCHPTDGPSNVWLVAVVVGSDPGPVLWTCHKKHTRIRHWRLQLKHLPRFDLRRMFVKVEASFIQLLPVGAHARTKMAFQFCVRILFCGMCSMCDGHSVCFGTPT